MPSIDTHKPSFCQRKSKSILKTNIQYKFFYFFDKWKKISVMKVTQIIYTKRWMKNTVFININEEIDNIKNKIDWTGAFDDFIEFETRKR